MEYLDEVLRRLATEPGYRPAGWSRGAILVYRDTVQCVDAASNDADFRELRSLQMHACPDLKLGAWSIRLDDLLLLVLSFKGEGPGAVAVLEFLSNSDWKARDE